MLETVRVAPALAFHCQRTRTWAARVAGEEVSAGTVLEMVTAETLSALPGGVSAGEAPEEEAWEAPAGSDADGLDPPEAANVCALQEPETEREPEAADAALERPPPLPAFLRPLERRLDAEIAPRPASGKRVRSPGAGWGTSGCGSRPRERCIG